MSCIDKEDKAREALRVFVRETITLIADETDPSRKEQFIAARNLAMNIWPTFS